MPRYLRVSVTYEHCMRGSDQRIVNWGVVTVYGESELAAQAELVRQHPEFTNIVGLSVEAK